MNLSAQFKDYLLSQSHPASKATVKNYISDVNRFTSWFQAKFNKEFSPQDVSYEIIESFRSESLGTYSASSVERNISSLRKFFSFLKLDSKISHSPFEAGPQKSIESAFDAWKIRDFKNYLYVLNASNLTIKNYIIDLKQFKNWIESTIPEANLTRNEANLLLHNLDSSVINDYKNRLLSELHLSPISVNRKLSSLRKYISWATEQGIIKSDIQVLNETRLNGNFSIPEAGVLAAIETQESPTAYSKFPPLRVVQKSGTGLGLLLDAAIIAPIAFTMNQFDHAFWLMKGKPVFEAGEKAATYSVLEPLERANKPITNIPKSFYAPTHISTANFPIHRKIWHNARYTRPDWYRKYHSYTFTSYLHFSILLATVLLSAYALAKNQAPKINNAAVLAGLPSAPARVLSFQGRITDASGGAIDKGKNLRMAIYSNEKASGSALLWQEVVNAKPDSDGIFNVLLGKSVPIPQSLFAQNSSLWLGVTVETTTELTPRQPIATVAYAANSETLQGYPLITAAANSANVVLALNSSGNLTMGGSPTFQATGGTFTLSGRALLLTTSASSNGNITLTPNGNGVIDLQKVIQNTSNNGSTIPGSVQVSDTFLVSASSPSQAALNISQSSTGDLIVASSSGVTKFRVNNAGNITAGSYNGLTVSSGTITSGTWNGAQIGSTYGGTGIDTSASTGVPFISSGTWSIDSNSLAPNHGGTGLTAYTTGDILYADSSTSLTALGIGGNGNCLVSNGSTPSWTSCSAVGGGSSGFTEGVGSIFMNNSTEDFLVGGQSTDSAKFAILGVNNSRGSQTASISGGISLDSDSANIGTNNFQTLTLGGNTTGGLILDSGNSSVIISDDTFIAGTLIASGLITADGGINVANGQSTTLASLTTDGGLLYTNGSGVVAQTGAGNLGECLISSGGGVPVFGSCSTNSPNYWQLNSGAISPFSNTADVLFGGTASDSAPFTFTGLSGNETQASISGNLIVMPNNGFGGNVGIGTSAPLAALDLEKSLLSSADWAIYSGPSQSAFTDNEVPDFVEPAANFFGALNQGGIKKYSFVGLNDDDSTNDTSGILGVAIAHNPSGSKAALVGIEGAGYNYSTGTVNELAGVSGFAYQLNAGTVTNMYSLLAITNSKTAGAITNNYGLLVEDQTVGTNDYGIAIQGADTQALWISSAVDNTDAANGIGFGLSRDTNLYRSAADTLRTDNRLIVGGLVTGALDPLGTFDARANSVNGGTIAVASISGATSFAGLVVDQSGDGDIFTASKSGASKFTITNSGAVFANNLTNTNQANTVCYNTSSGEVTYNTGSGCTSSSIRYKHDVNPLNDSLALLMRLQPVSFKYNENYQPDGRTHVGFIAEEVNQIDPRLVDFESDGITPSGVQYANITALLTQGVQEQQLQIQDNQTKLNSLETDLAITNSGNLSLVSKADDNFEVRQGETSVDRIGAFSELFVGKLKGGYFELGRLTVNTANIAFAQIENLSVNSLAVTSDNITIAGENIKDYIYSIVDERIGQKQIAIASPILETDMIKPQGNRLAIKLPTNDKTSKVEVLNASNSAVASIDAEGNASFSGTVNSNGLETTEASVAGTLKAGRIVADQLDLSADALNKLQGSISSSAGITNNYYYNDSPVPIASTGTGSANLASVTAGTGTFTNGLMSFGETSFYEASIANRLFIGAQLTIADHSINVLGDNLQIQPLAQGGVDFLAGKVVIDTDGNLKVNGNAYFAKDVNVNGTLFAGIIAPIPGKDLIFQFKDDENSAVEFKTGTASAVLSFNNKGDIKASGSGTFNKLNLSFVPKAIAVSDTEIIATGSAGTAEIKSYQNELTIKNPLVTKDSLIYITPKIGLPNQSVYLLRQVPGESFTVGISKVISKEVPFNWILIN